MTYEKKRVYIVVKTYPTISKEYSELVCNVFSAISGNNFAEIQTFFRKQK